MIIKPLTRVYSLRTLKALQRTAYARPEISELKVLYNQLNKLNKPIMNTFFIARIGCSSLKIKKNKNRTKTTLSFYLSFMVQYEPSVQMYRKEGNRKTMSMDRPNEPQYRERELLPTPRHPLLKRLQPYWSQIRIPFRRWHI